MNSFKGGDILAWSRDGNDDPLRCEVLEISNSDSHRARLKVDGWFGTTWETLDFNFELYSEWEAKRRAAKKMKVAA